MASINHWERSPAQLEVQAQQLQWRSLPKISDHTTTTTTKTTSIIRTKTTTTVKAIIWEDQPLLLQHQQSHPYSLPAVVFSTLTISKEVPNKRKRKCKGSPPFRKVQFFLTLFKRGGGVNPCSKIMSEIVVCSGGHLTTWNLHEKGLLRHWWWNLRVK